MRALLVLPAWPLGKKDFERCQESMRLNFPESALSLACFPKGRRGHAEVLGLDLAPYGRERALKEFDLLAFIELEGEREAEAASKADRAQVVRFDLTHPWWHARAYPMGRLMRDPAGAKVDAHVFNRLAPCDTDMYYYFPYGYLFRCVGLGPINEFGFRIDTDLSEFKDRAPKHILIAVFGGSSAWSLECLYTEMFTHQLERRLGELAQQHSLGLRFSVLNFAQHGHLVLNEMLTYLLFCDEIRPDIVIAHDGFNDFLYGMLSDQYLMEQAICYQFNHEQFAQKLHDSADRALVQADIAELKAVNPPDRIIAAYDRRKNQFRDAVTARGAKFVSVLQPYMESKGALSPEEEAYVEIYRIYDTQFGAPYRNVGYVYDTYLNSSPLARDEAFFDLHTAFKRFGADERLFVDFCHGTPRGDAVIANIYAEFILERVRDGRWFAVGTRVSGSAKTAP